MALSVTSSYYEMTEIATRILPNVVVLTFDPDRYNIQHLALSLYFLIVACCNKQLKAQRSVSLIE
jgi:hypothetical protein